MVEIIVMSLIPLLLIALAVFFIVLAATGKKGSGSQETALEILKKRYAKGEITKDDFDRMKKDL